MLPLNNVNLINLMRYRNDLKNVMLRNTQKDFFYIISFYSIFPQSNPMDTLPISRCNENYFQKNVYLLLQINNYLKVCRRLQFYL